MDHRYSLFRVGIRGTRRRACRRASVFAVSVVLQACAVGPRYPTTPTAVIEEAPAESSAEAMKRPTAAYLEGHRFAVLADDSVVGSIGTIELREGDTLSDVARHFGLGYEEIVAANPELDPWVIADRTIVQVPLTFVLPKAPRRGIVINLAGMRLFHYPAAESGSKVVTYPVGIGKEGRSTPTGTMAIAHKKKHPTWRPTANILNDHLKRGDPLPAVVPPGPDNPLGDYAMYLTAPRYLIHGTNKPYSIGIRASNGCIRLYPENVEQLFPTVPVREPVTIVNQPYLIGSKAGVVYLQAYQPHEEVNEAAAKQRIRSELKALEANRNQVFDWGRIDQILTEHRGIPFPISPGTPSMATVLGSAVPLAHPGRFSGQPIVPQENPAGWHVFAAETASEISARRMAGIMNHQGPPIPARVREVGERYHVVAGPFPDAKNAQKAAKRLKVDLELDGRVLSPETELAGNTVSPLPASTLSEPVAIEPEPTTPEVQEPADSIPEAVAPESGYPPDSGSSGEATPMENVPEGVEPSTAWPEPAVQEPAVSEPAWEPSIQEPAAAEEPESEWESATPPKTTEPAEGASNAVEPLDLSVPEQFSEPAATEPDVPLEVPPDMDLPAPARRNQTTP